MEFLVAGKKLSVDDVESEMLRSCASDNEEEMIKHRLALAQVFNQVLRQGVLEPDLLGGIYTQVMLDKDVEAKFPIDLYPVNKDGFYKAFVIPQEGKIPTQPVEGDEIIVPVYKIGNSIDWSIDFSRDARWDIINRAMEVYNNGFIQKINDDGWHCLLKAADVNTNISDSSATSGVLTKRLITGMQVGIKRLTGGRGSKLTDIWVSPEGLADIRNFDNTALDDVTLRNLLIGGDVPALFGVKLHEIEEFGYGQEYQEYVTSTLSHALTTGDEELCVGFDLKTRDSFMMPIRANLETFDDPALHRKGRQGVYGWMRLGFGALDSRRVLFGSF